MAVGCEEIEERFASPTAVLHCTPGQVRSFDNHTVEEFETHRIPANSGLALRAAASILAP